MTRFGTSKGDLLLLSVSRAAHLAGYLPILWDAWTTRNAQNFLDNSTTANLSSYGPQYGHDRPLAAALTQGSSVHHQNGPVSSL